MGGHGAWRKRLAAGLPAKGAGGAMMRHRPHFGRRGKEELLKNRKGWIGGGNPKRKKRREIVVDEDKDETEGPERRRFWYYSRWVMAISLVAATFMLVASAWLARPTT